MYAIIDIETTGGHASANGITEVAILLYNGFEVVERYSTLINPGVHIPIYIQALTGINDAMVKNAPSFKEVSAHIFDLLHDKIFVAHNVNFDYSFIKYHLANCGYNLQAKKLCTVRLGRKIVPGLPSYGLGKFCSQMGIVINNRHRALGDAEATAILFGILVSRDLNNVIADSLKQHSKEQLLPPNLHKDQVVNLPNSPGVYYFHNEKGKVIYVGKAKSLRKRVLSHFSNNSPGSQKQEFLRNIHAISHQTCGTELIAFILETTEIKRLWPAYNRSQKRYEYAYGLYCFEGQNGFLRLAIDKRQKFSPPIYTFNYLADGYSLLKQLITKFNLCPKLCFIQKSNTNCVGVSEGYCLGACEEKESFSAYNVRVKEALAFLKSSLPTYAIIDHGRSINENSCILMEQGQFYGFGYIDESVQITDITTLKDHLKPCPSNDYIRNLVHSYVSKHPDKRLTIS
ncbi:MAG: polymerase subunit epsilon [Sphingobacteriales bacterium]|nr:polymerase subunit epsilon [Sphingobacteriales bacterium]